MTTLQLKAQDPEVLQMKNVNRRSLTFALAVCLWSCLGSGSVFAQKAVRSRMDAALDRAAQAATIRSLPIDHPAEVALDGAAPAEDGRIQVMVELDDPAAAVIFAQSMKGSLPNDLGARRRAASATSIHISRLRSAQDSVAASITASGTGARELYRVQRAMNAIAVAVKPERAAELLRIPGVKRIVPIVLEHPTNSTSVPFIGTPNVWANTIGLPAGADGTGIRIGIIDTGIDYMHADFGGTGLLADYQAESTDTANFTTVGTATAGAFPTAKVVGGKDFAGDAYTGANAPVPDANPMDCNGHGSHVSGTAAGFGVTAANATFTGPYDANTSTYSPLKIGPGTAPKALLYGLRVFGCTGSTSLTTQAIDWAMDPNGDADLSDHLDVINMSLGSDFGSVLSATSISSDNAALAGVIVVTSAGNASDTFFIAGAPGAASRAIATAASVDDGVPSPIVQVNAPAGIAGNYLAAAATFGNPLVPSGTPPGPHNVVIALDAANGSGPSTTDGCTAFTNAAAVAGNIALIDRGTCGFIVKVANAQAAGAVAVIIADNAPGSPPAGLGGTDPTITIPSVRVTLADGNLLKANIATLNATLLGPAGGDTLASFSSRGPRRTFGAPLRLKPDIAAPGLNITSVQTGHTCPAPAGCTGLSDPSGFQPGNQTLTISGTSMASPHMAGIMALLRQLKPTWSVEELKALAMNYAINNVTFFPTGAPPRFGPSRIGGGRVDPAKSAVGNVVAMNADDAGVVSVTFNPEVVGVVTQVKKVRIENKGLTSQTYDLAFDNVVDSPGVSFSLPGGSPVTVAAGESVDIDVQMSANSSLMDHTRDASLLATQGVQANYGDAPRNFLTEEGSYLTFSQSATLKFRLPVYMAEKPSSNMSAADTIVTGGAPTGSTTIALSGTGLCSGTLAAGPTCTGTFPNDVESLVSPFELRVVSGVNPTLPPYADVHYVGSAFRPGAGSPSLANDLIMFGVASWGNWSTPNEVSYSICIDNNNDGVYDKILYNSEPSIFVANASKNDNFVRIVRDTVTNGNSILGLASFVNVVGPDVIDSALHLNNVMVLGANPTQLGYTSTANTTMRYKVVTCAGNNPGCARTTTGDRCSPAPGTFFDQVAGPFTYNWGAQGLNFSGDFLDEDLNGKTLPVSWNTANMAANGALGALILHHHNPTGKRAEVVLLDTAPSVDLSVALGSSPASPALNSNVTITVTITNPSVTPAANVEVNVPLPAGLTYVSDTPTTGTYSSATGLWTIPALVSGTSTLTITAKVISTDPQDMAAEISASTPLDPNTANNISNISISSPRSSDLVITMVPSAATAFVGNPITYTVTVKNNGVDPAYNVDVADSFPAFPALAPATGTASQGVYNTVTKTWDLAGLGSGFSATLALGLNAPNMAGALQNSATASATNADPNNINNTDAQTINILSPSDVSGVKNNNGPMYIGGTITYTIVLTNNGSYPQQNNTGNELTDVLPSTLTLVSANASSGTAATGSNTVTWNGSIPAGGTVTITVTATVNNTATVGSTISNSSTISYDADGNGTNEATRTAGSSFTVSSPATVTATKTVTGQLRPGGAITYTVVLTNSGPAAQLDNPGNEFIDTLPATLTLVSANGTSGTTTANGVPNVVTWNGSIPAGGTITITINATVQSNATPLSTISNQGTAPYDADGNQTNEATAVTNDPGTAAPNDPTSFTVTSPSGITTPTKTVSGSFSVGTNVTYTVTVHNGGPSAQLDNAGNEFTDVLPSSLALVSANASSGTTVATVGTNTVTWNGSIPNGANVTISIVATVKNTNAPLSTISNQGTFSADADGNGTNETTLLTNDPGTPAANDATTFKVTSPATIASASMTVSGTFKPGSNVTYTVTIQNGGPDTQLDNPGDEFTDTLPSSLTLVSVNASSGTASLVANPGSRVMTDAGETVHWNGSIPANGSVTITIVAQISPTIAAGTSVTNQGTVFFDADGNGTNESSMSTNDPGTGASGDPTGFAVVSPATVVSPSKSVNRHTAQPGDLLTYTVTINNSGSSTQSDNPGDEFTDVLPSGLTLISANASSGTTIANVGTNTVHWNGSIPVSGTVTITIVARVGTSSQGLVVSNQGTVFFDADGNGTNESSVLTDDPSTANSGDATAVAIAATDIPAVSTFGMLLMSALLAGFALFMIRRMT
jgi:uncharacterized repeat protein (TIGR01451 family)